MVLLQPQEGGGRTTNEGDHQLQHQRRRRQRRRGQFDSSGRRLFSFSVLCLLFLLSLTVVSVHSSEEEEVLAVSAEEATEEEVSSSSSPDFSYVETTTTTTAATTAVDEEDDDLNDEEKEKRAELKAKLSEWSKVRMTDVIPVPKLTPSTWAISATTPLGSHDDVAEGRVSLPGGVFSGTGGMDPSMLNPNPPYVHWVCYKQQQPTTSSSSSKEKMDCCNQIFQLMQDEPYALCYSKNDVRPKCDPKVYASIRSEFLNHCTHSITDLAAPTSKKMTMTTTTTALTASLKDVDTLIAETGAITTTINKEGEEEVADDPLFLVDENNKEVNGDDNDTKSKVSFVPRFTLVETPPTPLALPRQIWRQYLWFSSYQQAAAAAGSAAAANKGYWHISNVKHPFRMAIDPATYGKVEEKEEEKKKEVDDESSDNEKSQTATATSNTNETTPQFVAQLQTLVQEGENEDERILEHVIHNYFKINYTEEVEYYDGGETTTTEEEDEEDDEDYDDDYVMENEEITARSRNNLFKGAPKATDLDVTTWKASLRVLLHVPAGVQLPTPSKKNKKKNSNKAEPFSQCRTSKACGKTRFCHVSLLPQQSFSSSDVDSNEMIPVVITAYGSSVWTDRGPMLPGGAIGDAMCQLGWSTRLVLEDGEENVLLAAPVIVDGTLQLKRVVKPPPPPAGATNLPPPPPPKVLFQHDHKWVQHSGETSITPPLTTNLEEQPRVRSPPKKGSSNKSVKDEL